MRSRAAAAETIASHYGVAPSYLTPDERTALKAVSGQGGKPMTDVAGTLVAGFGDRAPAVLRELSGESPVLSHIGGLLTSGGSPAIVRDAAEAVRLRQDKEFKHPRWLDRESDAIQTEQNKRTVQIYGDAFYLAPDTGRASENTAQATFFTRSARQGYDPKLENSSSQKMFDRSLQEAAGATFDPRGNQYGGIAEYKPGYWSTYKVLIPSNIRADYFKTVIGELRDEDVAGAVTAEGKPYKASDFRSAIPVATKGGYRFAAGDPTSDDPRWIRGGDGKPFVLDIERMEPMLRKRVPGAYAGQ
jgi:hypothetical protein